MLPNDKLSLSQWEVVLALANHPIAQVELPSDRVVGNYVLTQREHNMRWRIAVVKNASEIARDLSFNSTTYFVMDEIK